MVVEHLNGIQQAISELPLPSSKRVLISSFHMNISLKFEHKN